MKNPLQNSLLGLLKINPVGINEHQLLQALARHPAFESLQDESHLSLFRKHFLVMNGLYRLQSEFPQEQALIISPLNIQIVEKQKARKTGLEDSVSSSLRDYYLDWNNFDKTGKEDIEKLLGSFWKRFYRVGGRAAAFKALDLTEAATQQEIKNRYRQLAGENHPDKGGDRERFIEIREAYEILIG